MTSRKLVLDALWTARSLCTQRTQPVNMQEIVDQLNIAVDLVVEEKPFDVKPDVEREKVPQTVPPRMVYVDTNIKGNGPYQTKSGKPKGLVVHYTAGHTGGPSQAQGVLSSLGARGLGCMTMDSNGTIYVPKELKFENWDSHAGSSVWKGEKSVSRLLMGMEICNPGKLVKHQNGKFYPYYAFKGWDPKNGFAPGAEERNAVDDDLVVHASAKDNIQPGYYQKFTPEQEGSLAHFCVWQLSVNPEFSIDWVVGHDEVSPGRKADPGGSLSLSMPEFRELLKKVCDEHGFRSKISLPC